MITEEQTENIINASYNMIQALVEAYGSEQGMIFWNQLGETLAPYFKGEIFKRMVCGEFSAKIRIKGVDPSNIDRIGMIKCLRHVDKRRLPLKEAKDLVDSVFCGQNVYIEPHNGYRIDAIQELKNAGFLL